MIKIGKKEIPSNILMAPMAGCTDLAFRTTVREYGAKFCFFEMVDAISLIMKSPRTFRMLKTTPKDNPIAAQLIGSDPVKMLDAAYILLDTVPDIVFLDINAACPVRKVLKKKTGAYLMKTPDTLVEIIKTLSNKLPIPVTIKIRTGYSKTDSAFLTDLVKKIEDNGASAIFIHGRTCSQMYSGEVDYTSIKEVKNSVSIPVFGSGNVFNPELAKKMFDETNCNGLLVARGALGTPWIFEDIDDYLKTGKFTDSEKDMEKKGHAMKEHIKYIIQYKKTSTRGNASFIRKIMMWYTKGFPDARSIRDKICKIKTYDEVEELVGKL
ncbi:MAG: tRNA dihydrouridine synthase DusB [Elusimicrobia bacterium]|nr:tRNA dihydrouridine synthase DusB [Elusimicrobiota bacterium]